MSDFIGGFNKGFLAGIGDAKKKEKERIKEIIVDLEDFHSYWCLEPYEKAIYKFDEILDKLKKEIL